MFGPKRKCTYLSYRDKHFILHLIQQVMNIVPKRFPMAPLIVHSPALYSFYLQVGAVAMRTHHLVVLCVRRYCEATASLGHEVRGRRARLLRVGFGDTLVVKRWVRAGVLHSSNAQVGLLLAHDKLSSSAQVGTLLAHEGCPRSRTRFFRRTGRYSICA